MVTVEAKRRRFRELHRDGCFVLPNPWDVGSLRRLEAAGFPAVATTSSGLAWSLGKADGEVGFDEVVAHLRALVAATDLPVNADFEDGYAVVLVGRAEGLLLGTAALDDTIARLVAYAEAGADCLYAPCIDDRGAVAELVAAVAPKPVNVLLWGSLRVADLAALGVRRVSLGGALAAAAWQGFDAAVRRLVEDGAVAPRAPAFR